MRRLIVTGLLALSGCSFLMPTASQSPLDRDYFPLKAGAVWVMQPLGSPLGAPGNPSGIGCSTVSIEAVEATADAVTAHLSSVTREGVLTGQIVGGSSAPFADKTGRLDVRKEPTGLISLVHGTAGAFPLAGKADGYRYNFPGGMRYERAPRPITVPYFRLPQDVGELSLEASASTDASNFSEIRQVCTKEPEVLVAAGRFADCLKITVTSHDEGLQRSIAMQVNQESVYWLAPGVGVVKKRLTLSGTNGTTVEEEELATCSIPR